LIICPYIKVHPKTRKTLDRHAPGIEYVYTGKDDYAYWETVNSRWGSGEDLIIVEQDIAITAQMIPSLVSCPRAWCTYAYPVMARYTTGPGTEIRIRALDPEALGCVKFSAAIQAILPFAAKTPWDRLDIAVRDHIATCGGQNVEPGQVLRPHCHGTVEHLHRLS